MARYKPKLYNTPLKLLAPKYEVIKGVRTKTFANPDCGILIIGSFKTYGGTGYSKSEKDVNGVYAIEDTAVVETWYRPDIKSDCRIAIAETGATYEIINEPEDIDLRHKFLMFKVRRVKGGA